MGEGEPVSVIFLDLKNWWGPWSTEFCDGRVQTVTGVFRGLGITIRPLDSR